MDQYAGPGVSNSVSLVVRSLLVGELSNGRAALYEFTPEGNTSSQVEPGACRLFATLGGHSRSCQLYMSCEMDLGLASTPPLERLYLLSAVPHLYAHYSKRYDMIKMMPSKQLSTARFSHLVLCNSVAWCNPTSAIQTMPSVQFNASGCDNPQCDTGQEICMI